MEELKINGDGIVSGRQEPISPYMDKVRGHRLELAGQLRTWALRGGRARGGRGGGGGARAGKTGTTLT